MTMQGHMAKAIRQLTSHLKAVDVVIEVVDARAPLVTRNPRMDIHLSQKPSVLVLHKSDLGGEDSNRQWERYWRNRGRYACLLSSKSGETPEGLMRLIRKTAENAGLRRSGSQLRCMVVGIPNVGKSTLINRLTGRRSTRTGSRAGVTRGEQWVQTEELRLLDLPGILPPVIAGDEALALLTILDNIPAEKMPAEEAALYLIRIIRQRSPRTLEMVYSIDDERGEPVQVLERIGRSRGCLLSGGRIDWQRSGDVLLKDYRLGKLGRVTLEEPPFPE